MNHRVVILFACSDVLHELHELLVFAVPLCLFAVLPVVAALAPAKNGAVHTALVALAVLLQTFGLLAFAPFLHLLVLNSQTEALVQLHLLGGRFRVLEPVGVGVGVASQRLDDSLLVFCFVGGVVAAVEAVAGF